MNEQEKHDNMFEYSEIIARALEIAITLTKADETWIRLEGSKDVVMAEPLCSTVRAVARILASTNLLAISGGTPTVLSGENKRTFKCDKL
jgi:hypothetical protein